MRTGSGDTSLTPMNPN